jgi:uncharacterized protein involved in exopolysaccharide biosynthesis
MMNDSHRKNLELAPKSAPAARRPEETSVAPSDRGSVGSAGQAMSAMVIGIFHELRRRWILAGAVWALAVIPALAYAIFAVPYYTSHGVLQVGSQGNAGMANPLFELTGAGQSQINTEVEVLKRRDFLSRVFKRLKLHVVDPDESSVASLDIDVTIHGASPVRPELTRIRAAIALAEIEPFTANVLPIRIAVEGGEILVQIDPVADDTVHRLAIGQELAHPRASLLFDRLPLDEGQAFTFALVADGLLVESLGASLSVASLGSTREPTNLVRIGFTHADRQLAQSVVQGIMDAYIEQGLSWQVQGATQAATFIRERLAESKEELVTQEEELKAFAEQSHAVQLDTQARVTIENTAEIETQRMKLDLQARVLDNMAEQVRRGATSGNVHLTTSLIEDPILAETVLGLTTAETQLSVLRATLTPEHPRLIELENKVRLQQAHVRRTIDTARKNVISESAELAVKLESASKALASYPEKELHLARLMREVEVRQRLYGFLLEKAQEAEILEASTTRSQGGHRSGRNRWTRAGLDGGLPGADLPAQSSDRVCCPRDRPVSRVRHGPHDRRQQRGAPAPARYLEAQPSTGRRGLSIAVREPEPRTRRPRTRAHHSDHLEPRR